MPQANGVSESVPASVPVDVSSPRVGLHRENDAKVEMDFDANLETDRGRVNSNGGYLAEQFTGDQLQPPLAPFAHSYIGNHAPIPDRPDNAQKEAAPNPDGRPAHLAGQEQRRERLTAEGTAEAADALEGSAVGADARS